MHLLGWRCFIASHLVGQALVFSHSKPLVPTDRGAILEYLMQPLDEAFGETFLGMVDNKINAAEVVVGLNDVVYIDALGSDAYGVGLENISCLVMREPTTFNLV